MFKSWKYVTQHYRTSAVDSAVKTADIALHTGSLKSVTDPELSQTLHSFDQIIYYYSQRLIYFKALHNLKMLV
jgi:hypothetical protein